MHQIGFRTEYCHAATRLLERADTARTKVEELSAELAGLEESLNAIDPLILVRFKQVYETSGAEQFRPNRNRVQCKFVYLQFKCIGYIFRL